MPPPRGKDGPQSQTAGQGKCCGSALALSTPGWGQGGGKTLESQAGGNPGFQAGSCSLDGHAAVAEELGDDGWVDYSGRVPQVMVILSDLPKHPPHDFPWGSTHFWLPGDNTLTHSSPAKSFHPRILANIGPWPIQTQSLEASEHT